MSRNRVEKLEQKVAELESTVTGLTEELVEAKDRIRDLEAELEPDPADGSQFSGREPRSEERSPASGDRGATRSPAGDRSGSPPEEGSRGCGGDSAAAASREGEGDKDEASQSEDEAADSDPGDDIIVA